MTAREVLLDGGSPWGFRMHGGADVNQPLKISRVNPGSKASIKGVREGDLITSINGQSTKDVSNSEAHALLKSAGDKLRLGLNEDSSVSPKRRQYKSVLQETHSETIKRSSISSSSTSYTISTTKETKVNGTKANENGTKENGDSKPNGTSLKSSSLNGSTDSTLTNSSDTKGAEKNQDGSAQNSSNVMADNLNSRSRRRRANRRKAKKAKSVIENKLEETNATIDENNKTVKGSNAIEDITTNETNIIEEEVAKVNESITLVENYRVESPKLDKSKKKNGTGTVVKSRSLDSEEMLKITELSENSETEDIKNIECNAIVAEADSDVEWEVTTKLDLKNLNLNFKEERVTSRISPEEERDLRHFLQGLDLVTSPQIAAAEIEKVATKSKRSKKREQLSQYFLPVYQNPRYLDAISEEGSDLSDREQKDKNKPTRNIVKCVETTQTPLLVKVIETPILKEVVCSTETMESISQAEIVHLDDSSSSSESPIENNLNADTEPIYENVNNSVSKEAIRKETAEKCETGSVPSSQLTPPPTPDNATPEENEIAQNIKNENDSYANNAAFEKEFKEVLQEQENVNNLVTPKLSRSNSGENDLIKKSKTENEIPQICITNDNKENIKTPQVSRSNSSDSSNSSVGTTQCTALYNPMVSSIGDVNSLLKDLECLKDGIEVGSLKEICLKKMVSLPFGADVLEELAVVSKSLEEFTDKLPKTQFHLPCNNLQALINTSGAKDSNTTFTLPVPNPKEMSKEKWVGLPTEDIPKTIIYLSPNQKEFLDSKKSVEKEADKFLDLHEKFSKRTSYEKKVEKVEEKKVVITSITKNVVESSGNNRLLDIIKNNKVVDDVNDKGGVEKGTTLQKEVAKDVPTKEVIEKASGITLPNNLEKLRNEARAKAQDLTEWLHLARNPNTVDTKRSESTNNSPNENSNRSRRRSLPHELYVRQIQYLIEKEKQIQKELEELESEKRKLTSEMYNSVPVPIREFEPSDYRISKNGDIAVHEHEYKKPRPKSEPQDKLRQDMYEEYMDKVAAREERKQNKVIKISLHNEENLEEKHVETTNELEHEFMDRVKKRMDKFGLKRDDSHEKSDGEDNKKPVLVMDGGEITEMKKIPKHLQELINLPTDGRKLKDARRINRALSRNRQQDNSSLLHEIDANLVLAQGFLLARGIWSPGQKNSQQETLISSQESSQDKTEDGIPPVWTPRSAGSSPTLERKEFRPVNFESPTLGRKVRTKSDGSATLTQTEPPWKSDPEKRLPTSFSAPGPGFSETLTTPRLPKAQNPTITLLQKAREGQIPKAAAFGEPEKPKRISESLNSSDLVYQVRTQDYISESDVERPKKIIIQPKKYEGIGPTTKDGMPITLRSEVRDSNMSQWYKKMYDTIHKQKPSRYDNDEYVTVRYKQRRGRYPYTTGYLSEPEPGAYDSDAAPLSDSNYSTLDRRRLQVPNSHNMSSTLPRNTTTINYKLSDVQHANEVYRNQPGRIENYTPGQSSISEHEAKKWWDEVMDIFDGWLDDHSALPSYNYLLNKAIVRSHLEQQKRMPQSKGYMSQALKESGYESDSTLVFRRRDDTAQQLSPLEQREVYKNIQKGGDVPLHGLRKLAPERPKDDTDLEYFPRNMRVHKKEFLCYPLEVPPHPPQVFATYKRSAPSSLTKPPSPPRRKSSRNNSTLRLITMKSSPDKTCKRHETCFTNDKTKVKYLREKISSKLSPPPTRKVEKRIKNGEKKEIKGGVGNRRCCGRIKCRSCSLSVPRTDKSISLVKERPASLERSFIGEKRKLESPKKIVKTTELKSPTEVKKAVVHQITSLNKPVKNRNLDRAKSPIKSNRSSPVPSVFSERSKSSMSTSLDSLRSTKSKITLKPKIVKPVIPKDKKLRKSKKDQLNVELVRESKKSKPKDKKEIPVKPKEVHPIKLTTEQLKGHKSVIQSDSFFQHLFLRDLPTPLSCRNSWILEKTQSLQSRKSQTSTSNALKVYLNHTKPVTDSKFRSLDAVIRSRSASPKSVTWKNEEKERSVSQPPKTIILTQTSRPVSPRRIVCSPTRMIRSISPVIHRARSSPSPTESISRRSTASPTESDKNRKVTPDKIIFTETVRPISPTIMIFPASPKVIRSPSCRKIKSRQYAVGKKKIRPLSAGDADYKLAFDPIYSTPLEGSSRFKELNKFYSDLERLGELEKTTSSSDLRPHKEIIDYERWRDVRNRERAEIELNRLYKQLKENQKEKDFLFKPKETLKWRKDFDRGLRIKEKSVENIREEFERMHRYQSEKEAKLREELIYKRGIYKPLWRGNSVINLANSLNERRSLSEGRARQNIIDSEKLLTHGVGSRIWSSLSMEQVDILKNQLTEIYASEKTPTKKDNTINVRLDRDIPPKQIKVRRNSDSPKIINNFDNQMSEIDKKKLSQSLSKEVLDRHGQKYRTSLSLVLGKETRGAIAAADAKVKTADLPSPRTCYSLEMSEDDQQHKENNFVLVLTKDDSIATKNDVNETLEIWAQPKKPLVKTDAVSKTTSISETESGSTEGSVKTVVSASTPKDAILEKVEYFENRNKDVYTPTIYKPAESTFDVGDTVIIKPEKGYLSQSYQSFKELYGESELAKMATEPLSASRKQEYFAPPSPKLKTFHRDIYRSRSLSPYYDESYASLKAGDVSRLKSKFEECYGDKYKLRRYNSDPQLNKIYVPGQNNGDVDMLRKKYEYPAISGRGRSRIRKGGIVSPQCLKAEDRFMPHINIISKIASLYPRKSPTPENNRSSEELANILGIPLGEVEKLRQRFDSPERMSLLGHMFTSSPNIHELRDIAQYLTGSWTAHKYPKTDDNFISLSDSRPKSTSPPRSKTKLSSILKSNQQRQSQQFDPSVHRPVPRYQPDLAKTEPVKFRSWWPPTPTHARPSVTFKEPEGPPPPPKGHYDLSSSESPRKYVENEVTIHYRTPVRQEVKEALSEDELAKRQADAMRKIYEEERRRKYLQVSHSEDELHDMNSRRHTDNFIPSQKSPISLNRYDDFGEDLSPRIKARPRSPEPRLVARALYNFVGQTARELTFKKGDIIHIRRQVDKNWYEGDFNAMVGLFPANYVEIVPYDGIKTTPRKTHEGQARAKYNFIAQTHLELSLAKGELVVITRRVDDNWFEGKIGGRKGIFPVSYVEVLIDPSEPPPAPSKPVASPAAHSLLLNGSSGGKESMGTHSYVPTFATQDLGMSYRAKPVQITSSGTYGSLKKNPVGQALHIETQSEPIPYRALYKYRPQNEDELELLEGDTVYVLEKCNDGWYVGSSDRTGAFGTFPGNYVERI